MAEVLRLEVHYRCGHLLVTVVGEVDIATVGLLRECLAGLARRGLPLVIDLDQVTFMDATGLGALVGGARRAAAHGASLQVVCVRPPTRKLVQAAGLEGRLGLCRTRAKAIAALPATRIGPRKDGGGVLTRPALAQPA
jgi:anti-sigma B factor antagonist